MLGCGGTSLLRVDLSQRRLNGFFSFHLVIHVCVLLWPHEFAHKVGHLLRVPLSRFFDFLADQGLLFPDEYGELFHTCLYSLSEPGKLFLHHDI